MKSISRDEHRVLNFHIQGLMSLAQDARTIALHDRLRDEDLIEETIRVTKLHSGNADAFLASFKAVMAFLGYDNLNFLTVDALHVENGRISVENARLRNERDNLKSQLAIASSEIDALRTAIGKSIDKLKHDAEVAGIPF